MAASQQISFGIGSPAGVPDFLTFGLVAAVALTSLTVRSRGTGLTVQNREETLTVQERGTALTVQDR